MLDSADVADALQRIDERIRQWNERGAPVDPHTGEVSLIHWMTGGSGDELDDPLSTWNFIDQQRTQIANAYVGALRAAHKRAVPTD